MPLKLATLVSFAGAISNACSMFYILEITHPIEIPLLSQKITSNYSLLPVIFSRAKSARAADKTPIISAQNM